MVYPQAVDFAFSAQRQNEPMRRVENRFVLHAQRSEVVDVEKPPVVDFVGRDAPGGKPVGLTFEERVQRIERRALRGRAVYPRERGPSGTCHLAMRGCELRELTLVHVLVALPFRRALARGLL